MMDTLLKDIRYGVRGLLKRPAFSVVAIITLALGIGANTAIFSVINAVMLKPLSYKEPDRLIALWEDVPGQGKWRVTPANFHDWRQQNNVFEEVAAFGASALTITGTGEPEQLTGIRVSAGFFKVIGVEPILGRTFVVEEHEPGKGQVVIIGYGLWQRRFGAARDVIGKSVTLDERPFTIVGVMPPGLYPGWPTTSGQISFNTNEQQYWTPMSFTAQWAAVRTAHVLGVVARLKQGITFEQARAEMSAIAARLEQEHAANKGEGIIVNQFMDELIGSLKPALYMLLAAVVFVLLIACANIAGLLLAQHAARSKEIAIRAALGAGRGRLVRQFFIEALLISFSGATIGIAIAIFGVDTILKLIPQQIPRLDQVQVDLPVLGFTLLLTLVTCLLFALIPAWQASKPDLQDALEQGVRSSGTGAGRHRLRQVLTAFQVSVAVMLVIGAALLIKSFWRLRQVDPGFRPEQVMSMSVSLPSARYSEPHQINSFYKQMLEAVSHLPGVRGVAISYDHPLEANWIDSFRIEGRPDPQPGESMSGNFTPVSWDYFSTIGAEIIKGRQFNPQDDEDHPGVAIVNEEFVRRYFPNDEALGQRIRPSPPGRIWENKKLTSFEIVGIVRNVKSGGLNAESEPTYYLPASQAPLPDMNILLRTQGDPATLIPAIRSAVFAIDPNQPIADIKMMEKVVADNIAQPRLNMVLMALFGAVALLLAAVGIYGLLSYAVTQRTQEIGIRMALGAQVNDVLGMVLKQGMALALVGEAIGLVGAIGLSRLLRNLLFEVAPTDIATFVVVTLVLTVVALVACYLPARRAAKVDPLVALRYE